MSKEACVLDTYLPTYLPTSDEAHREPYVGLSKVPGVNVILDDSRGARIVIKQRQVDCYIAHMA